MSAHISCVVCKPRWRKIGIKEWTIDVCATMQESGSKQVGKEAEVGFYTLFSLLYWIGMGWVIIMSRTNESDA